MVWDEIQDKLINFSPVTIYQDVETYFGELIDYSQNSGINIHYIFIFICVALSFFFLSFSLLVSIYFNRLKRKRRNKKIKEKKFSFQILLYEALVENEATDVDNLNKSIIEKFKQHNLESRLSQQALIDLIISLKHSFTGHAEQQLIRLYHDLKLYELSLKKLKSSAWGIQVEGIRELAEMRYQHAWLEISRLRLSRQPILAQEAQIASIKLAEKIPLYFLDNYLKQLTNWQQLSFYHQLLSTDNNLLPDFSRWLGSGNESLIIFSLKMIGQFRQTDVTDKVAKLLEHKSIQVKFHAVQTLVRLKADRYVNRLFNLLDVNDLKLKVCVIQAIGRLGTHYHKVTLRPFLLHESYHIRLATAKAVKGITIKNISENKVEIEKQMEVLNHVADPFL